MQISKTIVVNCAGVGSRLGFGHTKALLKIAGKPLIVHHLEQLAIYDDIRVVVGFDSTAVIDTVLKYRKNVMFVFNHNYLHSHTLASLFLGSRFSNEYVVSLDGDLLIDPKDLSIFLSSKEEIIGYTEKNSDNAVYVDVNKYGQKEYATEFSRNKISQFEWTGLVQIKQEKITNKHDYVYQTLESHLPISAMKINCREIDTPRDYENAINWSKTIFK